MDVAAGDDIVFAVFSDAAGELQGEGFFDFVVAVNAGRHATDDFFHEFGVFGDVFDGLFFFRCDVDFGEVFADGNKVVGFDVNVEFGALRAGAEEGGDFLDGADDVDARAGVGAFLGEWGDEVFLQENAHAFWLFAAFELFGHFFHNHHLGVDEFFADEGKFAFSAAAAPGGFFEFVVDLEDVVSVAAAGAFEACAGDLWADFAFVADDAFEVMEFFEVLAADVAEHEGAAVRDVVEAEDESFDAGLELFYGEFACFEDFFWLVKEKVRYLGVVDGECSEIYVEAPFVFADAFEEPVVMVLFKKFL